MLEEKSSNNNIFGGYFKNLEVESDNMLNNHLSLLLYIQTLAYFTPTGYKDAPPIITIAGPFSVLKP